MIQEIRPHGGNSRGFTLIELLVVVAIIALLISILMPSLNGARKQAKQLLCLTNLRSQGQAAYYYAEQNKDWYVRHNADYANMHFAAAFLAGLKPDRRLEFWDGRVRDAYSAGRQKRLIDICEAIPQYQCPSHPVQEQKLDYVVNGLPWPYTAAIARRDASGGGQKGEGPRGQSGGHWVNFFKLSGQSLDGNLELKVQSAVRPESPDLHHRGAPEAGDHSLALPRPVLYVSASAGRVSARGKRPTAPRRNHFAVL